MDNSSSKKPKTRNYKPRLTNAQKKFIQSVKQAAPDGLPTKEDLIKAAKDAYDIGDSETHTANSIASTIAGQNLRKSQVREALGIDDSFRRLYMKRLWQCLEGNHPDHPNDKELLSLGLKIGARAVVPSEEHVEVNDKRLEQRTDEELKFYVQNGYWPEQQTAPAQTDKIQ